MGNPTLTKVANVDTEKDFEFLEFDRITKIQSIFNQYGIDNFCISYSGGKDSTVLSELIDIAVPNNKIPRVYVNTGIEYNLMVDFVTQKAKYDKRFVVIQPKVPIIPTLKEYGYPFKSKQHSKTLSQFQREKNLEAKTVKKYISRGCGLGKFNCPKSLLYQFSSDFDIKISDKCCVKMKEEPLRNWAKDNGYLYHIIGVRASEGGRRSTATCLAFRSDKLYAFQPLAIVPNEFVDWFVDKHNVELCQLYKSPYNFVRTGCKGCPFAINLQEELETLEKYFPSERSQCERIWKPIYSEYRRIGYRLKERYEQMEF